MNKRALLNISAFVGVLVLILGVMVFPISRMAIASAQTVNEDSIDQGPALPVEESLDPEFAETDSVNLPRLATYAATEESPGTEANCTEVSIPIANVFAGPGTRTTAAIQSDFGNITGKTTLVNLNITSSVDFNYKFTDWSVDIAGQVYNSGNDFQLIQNNPRSATLTFNEPVRVKASQRMVIHTYFNGRPSAAKPVIIADGLACPSDNQPKTAAPDDVCTTTEANTNDPVSTGTGNFTQTNQIPAGWASRPLARPVRLESIEFGVKSGQNIVKSVSAQGGNQGYFVVEVTLPDDEGLVTYVGGEDFTVSGNWSDDSGSDFVLNFYNPPALPDGAEVQVKFLTHGPIDAAARAMKPDNIELLFVGKTCEGGKVPPAYEWAPLQGSGDGTNKETESEGVGGYATIRQYARAFNPNVHSSNDSAIASNDLRYTKGATFELWLGDRNSTTSGPVTRINRPEATCTIADNGFCDLRVPTTVNGRSTEYVGKRVWVVQTKAADGAYWGNEIKTGDYDGPEKTTRTIGYTDPLKDGKTYNASLTGNDREQSFGAAVQALDNPNLPPTCNPGPKIALVMDLSASISEDEMRTYQNALTGQGGLVDKLAGTNSSLSAYTFSWGSPSENNQSIRNYSDLVNVDTNPDLAKKIINDRMNRGGRTNWNQGLAAAYEGGKNINDPARPDRKRYDLVLFITDGNPNTTGSQEYRPAGNDVSLKALEGGVYAANELKAEGTRVVAVAVGREGQNTPENLRLISGQKENVDYFNHNWDQLAESVSSIVRGVSCQGKITVTKEIVNEQGEKIADGADWGFTAGLNDVAGKSNVSNGNIRVVNTPDAGREVQQDTKANGTATWGVNFNTESTADARATAYLSEEEKAGYKFREAVCKRTDLNGKVKQEKTISELSSGRIELGEIALEENWDCLVRNQKSAPKVDLNKQVVDYKQLSTGDNAGKWQIDYDVTVTNSGDTDVKYSLNDELRYGQGLNPEEATWRKFEGTNSTPVNQGRWTNLGSNKTAALAQDDVVESSSLHRYRVTVIASLEQGTAYPAGRACVFTNGVPEPGGFLNTASLTPEGLDSQNASACAEPEVPEILKVGKQVEPIGDGEYEATYLLTVRNRTNIQREGYTAINKNLVYSLTDQPSFPEAATVTGWTVSARSGVSNFSEKQINSGTLPIEVVPESAPQVIAPGTQHQYEVKIRYKLEGLTNVSALKCESNGGTGGLRNTATVKSGAQTRDAVACLDGPDPTPTFKIGVEKWGDDGSGLKNLGDPASGNSYGFEIRSGEVVTQLTKFSDSENGGYLTADLELEPGTQYQLVETEAPVGYELLPAPVTFTITRQTDGSYELQIQDSGTVSNVVAVDAVGDPNLRLLKVTDVRRGELPHTGGVGVQLPILLGGALIAAGALMGRRKVAA
ncbi:VWA domain-containing protein [Corynebacterium sp. Marseille-P4321]|uniref:VWA domain-containing protein n=1 Tax=Corynebacterium sp. Marseille-P4321 TaxID=2736603 RepID=UPI00158AD7B6|nr:VWA domain-containing protein [Corynebacterium sp. Marseille-P4321]